MIFIYTTAKTLEVVVAAETQDAADALAVRWGYDVSALMKWRDGPEYRTWCVTMIKQRKEKQYVQ